MAESLRGALVAAALALLAAAGAPAARADAPPLDASQVLPGVDPDVPVSAERARVLRDEVRVAREDSRDALVREEIACHRRFLVNRCLADVARRTRAVESRLDRIEVVANRTLREAQALELNQRTADGLARRAEAEEPDAARRAANREAREARVAASLAGQAQRDAEAPELDRRAAAHRAERERRDAENAARRQEADRRAAQAPANAAARERELEARRRSAEARAAQEQVRRERRKAEQAQRDEDARRRLEQSPPRRPGSAAPRTDATSSPPTEVPAAR